MTLLSVPDMTCGHCKASVTQALAALPGAVEISVDLSTKQVKVAGTTATKDMLAALNEIGFTASVIAAK